MVLQLDETPLKIVLMEEDLEDIWKLASGFEEKVQKFISESVRDAEPSKLLALLFTISVLVDAAPGQYMNFTYRPPMPYMSMARTTADVYFLCTRLAEAALHLGKVKELFPYVQFTCAADGDDSIALAQHARSTLPENDREIQMLMPCDAHLKCTNRVATFSLDKELNSYFTHVTLSLRFGNNLWIFRRSVDLVLDEAMTVEREQQPSTLARSRNEKLLNDLVLDRPGNSMVRWLLLTYFLDDWPRVGRFKIFLANGGGPLG